MHAHTLYLTAQAQVQDKDEETEERVENCEDILEGKFAIASRSQAEQPSKAKQDSQRDCNLGGRK